MHTGNHRPEPAGIAAAAEAPLGLMRGLAPQGLASIITGNVVEPDQVDGLVDTVVGQLVRG